MADAIRGNVNVERFRETQTQRAAVHGGDAARAGAAEHKETVLQDEGPATVVRYEELTDGRLRMDMSDGRALTRAANGVLKEVDEDGTTRLSLPNGILIQRDADGSVAGFDPRSGEALDVKSEQRAENGQTYFTFKDPSGASWLATSDTLRFEVWNPSGTIHQKVHSTGGMAISTCTVRRDPQTGVFRQDTEHLQVRPDGSVYGHGVKMKNVELSEGTLRYTQADGVRLEADLAYPVPFELQGGGKPQAPPLDLPPLPPTPDEPEAIRPAPAQPTPLPSASAPAPSQAPPFLTGDGMPDPGTGAGTPPFQPGAGAPGMPPGAGVPPYPPGAGAPGMPPGAGVPPYPPGAGAPGMPPGAGVPPYPPGAGAPGMPPGAGVPPYPPGAGAPGMPPGMQAPGGLPGYYPDLPPGFVPPGGMPPGGMPPGGMPPGGMPPGGMPPGGMPPYGMPSYGMPPNQPLWGTGVPPNVPWEAAPFTMGATPPSPLPADPFATVTTANGLIRQQQPDGSMFISLPNSIVVAQGTDGIMQVFDPRGGQPLPVVSQDVVTPNGGPEKQLNFRDAAGNSYMMYSKSLDFVVTSPDGNVRQVVLPQGNILVMAQTPVMGPDGKPTVQQHMAEIYPNGQINTFGDRGMMMGLDRMTVQTPGQPPMTLPLAYPIPRTQGMINTLSSVNPGYSTAVSGLNATPGTTPPPGYMPPGQGPVPPGYGTGQPGAGSGPWGTPPPPTPPPTAPPSQPAPQAPPQAGPATPPPTTPTPPAPGPVPPEGTPPAPEQNPPAGPAPMPGPPQDPRELMDAIMKQVQEAGLDAASCDELRILLPKVLTSTATEAEQARADELIQKAVNAKGQQPSTPAPAPTAPAQPVTTAPAPPAAVVAEAPTSAPVPPTAVVAEPPTAAPAPPTPLPAEVPAGNAADGAPTAAAPQATPPPVGGPARPQLQPEQAAMVEAMLGQIAGANPSPQVLAELQPLLERIVANVATADDVARADALVQTVMAGDHAGAAPADAASTPAGTPAAPQAVDQPKAPPAPEPMFGTPHVATRDELLVAAAGHPEYALASNPPKEYFDSLQRQQEAQEAAQKAAAAAAPPPPAPAATPPPPPPPPVSGPANAGGSPPPISQSMGGATTAPEVDPVGGPQATAGAAGASEAAGAKEAEEARAADGKGSAGDAGAARGPHKPGVWQKIKDFFTGKSHETGQTGWNSGWNNWQQPNWGGWNPYPYQMYNPNPYAPYAAMQGMLAANMMATTFSTMMMMPSMYYWNPCGMWGMPTMGYPYMW